MRDESVLGFALVAWLVCASCLECGAWLPLLLAGGTASLIWVVCRSPFFAALAALCFVGAHAAWFASQAQARVIPYGEVRLVALVVSAPELAQADSPWMLERMQEHAQTPRFRVRAIVEQVDDHAVEPFGLWLSLPKQLFAGDRIEVTGELRELPSAQWEYDLNARSLAQRRGIHATLSVTSEHLVTLLQSTSTLARSQAQISERLIAQGGGAVASAMVLGDRRFLLHNDEEAMSRAGFVHVISVSGLHLTAVGAALYWLLRRLLGSRVIAVVAALCCVWAYAMFSGAEAPALRSAIMQSLTMVALLLHRSISPRRTLALSLTALVALFPESTREPSFALSFVTMLALVVVMPRLKVTRWLSLPLTSLVASVAAWPLCAMWFGNVSLAGVLTNLVAVPLSTLVMLPLGALWLVTGLGAPLLGFCGDVLLWLAHMIPSWLVWDVMLRGHEVVLAYLFLAFAMVRSLRVVAVAFACAFCAAFVYPAAHRYLNDAVELHTLPVGQGDGHVLFLPQGKVVVVDGGGSIDGRSDPGRRVLRPFLLTHRVRSIDAVVLTHAHPDHYQGLADVFEHFSVSTFVWNGQGARSPGMQHLLSTLRTQRVEEVLAGDAHLPSIRVLHPLASKDEIFYGELGLNDNSIVLRVEHAGRSILMTGDIEASGESVLHPPASDVLKLAHHGSHTSTTTEWLRLVKPSVAVVSAGRANLFGHPHSEVLARLQGVQLLRTDQNGHVQVRLGTEGISTKVFDNSPRTATH